MVNLKIIDYFIESTLIMSELIRHKTEQSSVESTINYINNKITDL